MIAVFESVIPIFALIVTGFALRKSGFIAADRWQVLEEICFWLFFPALLTQTLIKADMQSLELGKLSISLVSGAATLMIILLILRPFLRSAISMHGPQFTSIFQTSSRWHGFIAMAIVLKLYGAEGGAIVAVAMAVLVPVLNTVNILVLAAYSLDTHQPLSAIARAVATNPIVLACVAGLSINLLKIPVWDPLMTYMDLMGRGALAASLLALGAGLSFKAATRSSGFVVFGVVNKLFLMPLLMGGYAIALGVSGLQLTVLIICAAVPTAMNGYILARKMGGDTQLYAATSTIQTVLSFATIPLMIWITKTFLGGI